MNTYLYKGKNILGLAVLVVVATFGLIIARTLLPSKIDNSQVKVEGNRISVDVFNRNKFVTNILGPEYLDSSSTTDFYSTDKTSTEIISDINRELIGSKWQLESDWGHLQQNALIFSTWKKGNSAMTVIIFDDLDSVGIDGLNKNYGISGLTPGQCMVVVYIARKL